MSDLAFAVRSDADYTLTPTGEDTATFDIGSDVSYARALLSSATLWLDAANSSSGEQTAVNQGSGGSALNATYGSTGGVDTNDPLFLPHTGENYVYFPGVTDNYVRTSFVAYNQTGDVEIVVQTKGINWSDATRQTIFGSWSPGFLIDKFNATSIIYGTSNSATNCYTILPHGLTGVVDQWFKMVYVKSTGTILGYKSVDGVSWTDISSSTNTPSPGVDFPNGTSFTRVGDRIGPLVGRVPFAQMKSGIGGTPFLTYREAGYVTSSSQTGWTGEDGNTWGVIRSTTGRKLAIVTRPIWLFGTDDYLQIPDNALLDFAAGDSFTLLAVTRKWGTTDGMVVGKATSIGISTGYTISAQAGAYYFAISDGTVQPFTPSPSTISNGNLQVQYGVRNVPLDNIRGVTTAINSTATDTTTGTPENALPFRVGARSGGTDYCNDAEYVAVSLFRRVLTTTEIDAIVSYYGAT
jgi:hypothetical protein